MRGIFIFVIFVGVAYEKRIPNFAGPYRLIFKSISNESDEFTSTGKIWARFFFSHPKTSIDRQYAWGQSYIGTELNDDLTLDVRIATWANNQWKKNAFVMKFDNACTAATTHARTFTEFAWGADGKKCPLSPRGLQVHGNRSYEIVFPTFPIMPYARYRFAAALKKEHKTIGLLAGICDAVPKL